jgi:hypothetical protein
MSTLAHTIEIPSSNRGVLSVRVLAWIAAVLFLTALLLIPRGITVFWSTYFLSYGPAIAVDLASIVGFVICRTMGRRISFAYLFISLVLIGAVGYDTWFDLRLRWYECF